MRNFNLHFSLILMVALFILIGQAASAQVYCAPRDKVASELKDQYGETLQSRGLSANGQSVVETWANTETGTWTVTMTDVSGTACAVAAGQVFENVEQEAKGDPA